MRNKALLFVFTKWHDKMAADQNTTLSKPVCKSTTTLCNSNLFDINKLTNILQKSDVQDQWLLCAISQELNSWGAVKERELPGPLARRFWSRRVPSGMAMSWVGSMLLSADTVVTDFPLIAARLTGLSLSYHAWDVLSVLISGSSLNATCWPFYLISSLWWW